MATVSTGTQTDTADDGLRLSSTPTPTGMGFLFLGNHLFPLSHTTQRLLIKQLMRSVAHRCSITYARLSNMHSYVISCA